MSKEKEIIMMVLQSHALKKTDLLSDFAREEIADEIMEAQKLVWNEVLNDIGIELVKAEDNKERAAFKLAHALAEDPLDVLLRLSPVFVLAENLEAMFTGDVGVEEVEPGAGDARHLVLGLTAGADEEGGVLGADEHLHRGVLSRLLCAGKGMGTISFCFESG